MSDTDRGALAGVGAGGTCSQAMAPALFPDGFGVCLANVDTRPTRWLMPERIALHHVTVLDGDPGQGKSCIMLDIAARLTRGLPMPLADPQTAAAPANVVVVSAEDSVKEVIRPRLAAAGADLQRVLALTPNHSPAGGSTLEQGVPGFDGPLQLPRDIGRLAQVMQRSGAVLLILDPLVAFVGEEIHWHVERSVRRVLGPLTRLAEEFGIAIVVIRHLNKHSGPKAIYRGGGSISIIGTARSGLLALSDPDDPRVRLLVTIKANITEPAPALRYTLRSAGDSVRVHWLDQCRVNADALLRRLPRPEENLALAEAVTFLRTVLADGPLPVAHALYHARQLRIADITLKRAKLLLGVVSRFESEGYASGGHWVWLLPKEDTEAEQT